MTKTIKESKEWFKTRDVLWLLVFTGFAVNYMIRINLNIAIVSMIKQLNTNATDSDNSTNNSVINPDGILRSLLEENDTIKETSNVMEKKIVAFAEKDSKTFEWNEHHQGLVLGAFFWFHWMTQIPGGILSKKYGTKLVFGLTNFIGVLCCFVTPIGAYMGYEYLISIRAFQGMVLGFTWPAMHNMAAKWIPPNERSRFVTAYLGSSIGAALTNPMCGWIIAWWNWELVFYVSGILGSIWYLLWYLIVFDSPEEHPRISPQERHYILSSTGQTNAKENATVPWKSLLTSLPLWMNILAQWGGLFGLFTLMTHGPTYLKVIHHLDIKSLGILSGMPHVFRTMFALGFSQLGDYLLTSDKMSRTNVRKLAVFMCCVVQGIFMLGLAHSGTNHISAIICLTAALTVNGAVSTGPLASVVDISPNYASIALGICNTIVAMVGYITPIVVSYLTYENQTVEQWQKVFWLASAMLIVAGIFYILFSNSELQPWNSPQAENGDVHAAEMKFLEGEIREEEVAETEKRRSTNEQSEAVNCKTNQ